MPAPNTQISETVSGNSLHRHLEVLCLELGILRADLGLRRLLVGHAELLLLLLLVQRSPLAALELPHMRLEALVALVQLTGATLGVC